MLIGTRRVLEQLIAVGSARRATPAQREAMVAHAQKMVAAAKAEDLQGYMDADQEFDHVNHDACRPHFAIQPVPHMIILCRRLWYAFRYDGALPQGSAPPLARAKKFAARHPARASRAAERRDARGVGKGGVSGWISRGAPYL